MDPKTSAFVTNLVFSGAVGLIALTVFSFLRTRIPVVYQQRAHWRRPTLAQPPNSFLGWIPHVLRLRDADYVETYGLEAHMLVRLMRTGVLCFAALSLFGLVILAPVYGTGDNARTRGINVISLSNLIEGDARFAATIIATYAYSLIVAALLFRDYRAFVAYRVASLNRSEAAHHTVFVLDVAAGYRHDGAVLAALSALTDDVATARMVDDAGALTKKHDTFEAERAAAERAAFDWEHPKKEKLAGQRPEHRVGTCACCNPAAQRVDSIDWHNAHAEYLSERVGEIQSTLDPAYVRPTNSAIVQFQRRTTASLVAQSNLWRNTHEWQVVRAPEPRAVNWNALGMTYKTVPPRRTAAVTALVLLIIFWSIPVGFAISLANLEAISQLSGFGWLDFVQDLPAPAVGLIQGTLPIIILNVFLALVPAIMKWIVSWQRIPTLVRMDETVTAYYTAFLIMQQFLVVTIFGSFLSDVSTLVNDPTSIVTTLGTSIPQNSIFFMNLILINALTGFTIKLILIVPALLRWLKRRFLARTERELDAADECGGPFNFTVAYSTTLVIAWLGLIYSPLMPLVSVVALVFFAIAYLAIKYAIAYVHTQPYHTDGALFFSAFRTMVWAMLLMQAVVIATIALNKSWSAVFAAPLLVATAVFGVAMNKRFRPVAEYGSVLAQARVEPDVLKRPLRNGDGDGDGDDVDEETRVEGEGERAHGIPAEYRRAYVHPGLVPLDEWQRVGPARDDTVDEYKDAVAARERKADARLLKAGAKTDEEASAMAAHAPRKAVDESGSADSPDSPNESSSASDLKQQASGRGQGSSGSNGAPAASGDDGPAGAIESIQGTRQSTARADA